MPEIELKKKTPEQIASDNIVLTINNNALKGCLEAVHKSLLEIKGVAVKNDFPGDMLIVAETNNSLDLIEYVLKGGKQTWT